MIEQMRAGAFEVADPRPGSFLEYRRFIGLVASERGLRLLLLPEASAAEALREIQRHYPESRLAPEDSLLVEAAAQVRAYLDGEPKAFAVPLDLRGHSAFELAVWAAAQGIPYGETRSYRWVSGRAGGGRGGTQAAGAALGANPLPLIIPCHRVIGSDGALHGYAGGLDMKAWLLALERGQHSLGLNS
jgi:O-6-methylguanine DNA methyltransferase